MALKNAFAELSVEDTQRAIAYFLAAILEKMPRTDTADRLISSGAEVTQPVSGTLTGVTTVTAVTSVTNLAAFGGSRPADFVPSQIANMGALHLYNNLKVT